MHYTRTHVTETYQYSNANTLREKETRETKRNNQVNIISRPIGNF